MVERVKPEIRLAILGHDPRRGIPETALRCRIPDDQFAIQAVEVLVVEDGLDMDVADVLQGARNDPSVHDQGTHTI